MRQKTTYNFSQLWAAPRGLVVIRPGTAWGIDDGILKEYSANVPRILKPFGLCVEDSASNVLLYSRDQTDGAYTVTNGSVSRNEVGIDGVENTASTFTTTSENAVIEQLTSGDLGDGSIVFSVYAKLKSYTISATVTLRIEGGGDTVEATIFPNSEGFIRGEVSGIFNTTLSSTTCYLIIAEIGVELIMDQWQLEAGTASTTPIVTEGTIVGRDAEQVYMDLLAEADPNPLIYTNLWFNKDEGVCTVVVLTDKDGEGCALKFQQASDSAGDELYMGFNRTETQSKLIAGINDINEYVLSDLDSEKPGQYSLTMCYKQGLQLFAMGNVQPISPNTDNETFDLSGVTRMWIGNDRGTKQINGYVQEITYYSNFMQLSEAVDGLIEQPEPLIAPVLEIYSFGSDEIVLNYTRIKDAVNYELEVSTNAGFTEVIETTLIGSSGSFTYERFTITRAYWFRVRGITDVERGPYSNIVNVYYEAFLITQSGERLITQNSEQITTQ